MDSHHGSPLVGRPPDAAQTTDEQSMDELWFEGDGFVVDGRRAVRERLLGC
ncbi:hypothetical protein [Nocardia sp. alder85J]|uniref:hypothetical protein n=1 Tax=Nocardia sp. alder85J TaxID=2862949 RepID=UPI001CD58844|nr:hypothetical protein [Nocardia sp. alder85J]MCX4097525.1 hypothetical protein [Nocardia sp. alder85J]